MNDFSINKEQCPFRRHCEVSGPGCGMDDARYCIPTLKLRGVNICCNCNREALCFNVEQQWFCGVCVDGVFREKLQALEIAQNVIEEIMINFSEGLKRLRASWT